MLVPQKKVNGFCHCATCSDNILLCTLIKVEKNCIHLKTTFWGIWAYKTAHSNTEEGEWYLQRKTTKFQRCNPAQCDKSIEVSYSSLNTRCDTVLVWRLMFDTISFFEENESIWKLVFVPLCTYFSVLFSQCACWFFLSWSFCHPYVLTLKKKGILSNQ